MKFIAHQCLAALFFTVICFSNIFAASPMQVTASILPIQYFIARIGMDKVKVNVMVKPGASPETYAPTPKQIQSLHASKLYYRIGVPFENAWLPHIAKINPHLKIIDLRQGIPLHKLANVPDPHIWNDPLLVMQMAHVIKNSLTKIDPANKSFYYKNYRLFIADLNNLHKHIIKKLKNAKNRVILVYHPAWGYFAKRYGLQQIAFEKEGKEASLQYMLKIVKLAKRLKINTIFVEPQFSKTQAQKLAQIINAKIVEINPLAANYLANMQQVVNKIVRSLGRLNNGNYFH